MLQPWQEPPTTATNPRPKRFCRTASYLANMLSGKGLRITRIAFGMPVGADFQFVDAQTLGRSLSGRKDFS